MIGGLLKSVSSAALFATVGLFVVGSAVPAKAADLGGDCCADLEERVAELEATAARKGNRRVSLTISGQVSTAVMAWDAGGSIAGVNAKAAGADTVVIGPPVFSAADPNIAPDALPVVDANTPGHIDPAHVHGDHSHTATIVKGSAAVAAKQKGRSRDVYIVENVPSGGTFFALTGDAKINPKLTAGFNVTIALDTGGRSHQVSQFDDDGTSDPVRDAGPRSAGGFDTDIVLTLANWYLDHKDVGRVTVGRINTASAGTVTVDLGGAGVTANAQVGYTQRGFVDPNTGTSWAALLGGNTVNGASLSRANAISYTSPTFGGFSVSAAWGENDAWDAAIRFAGEFSGFRVAAALAYADNLSGLGDSLEDNSVGVVGLGIKIGGVGTEFFPQISQVKGSASILHVATGLYLTGAYVNQDNDTLTSTNTTLWYVQGGVSKNWTGLGNTTIYGEYTKINDAFHTAAGPLAGTFSDATVWGLGIVQAVDAAALDLFLSYRNFSADAIVETQDFNVVMGGARIKF
jgi:porin-like protein